MVRSSRAEPTRSIRVLLRPGKYSLREAITIQAPSTVSVVVETMEMPDSFNPVVEVSHDVEPVKRRRRKRMSFMKGLGCRSVEVEYPEEEGIADYVDPESSPSLVPSARRATLTLRTRRTNEPIVRVRQGHCVLRNLELRHISHGIGKFFEELDTFVCLEAKEVV